MTKFNNEELISNYPNWTCINPKLNSNKPILCSKSEMHQTEAEGQKPISGIMQLVNKGIVVKGITQIGTMQKGITRKGIMQIGIMRKGITRKGITQIGITK